MKKILSIAFLVFTVFILNSCCKKGSGDVTTEKRNLDKFTRIELEGSGTLYLRQGENQSVEVKTDNNLQEHIKTKISGDKLYIDATKCIKRVSKLEYYVTVQSLEKLEISGSGDVIGENTFNSDKLNIIISGSGKINMNVNAKKLISKISGAGKIELSGNCYEHELKLSGSGKMVAYDLQSKETNAIITGSGDCQITVFEKFDGEVSGSGNIYYKGNPKKVNTNISGSGAIKARD